MSERRGRKPSTRQNIESEVRVHLAPFLGDRSLDRITPEDIADLIANLEGKGLAPKTIHNIIGTCSALFTFPSSPQGCRAARHRRTGFRWPSVTSLALRQRHRRQIPPACEIEQCRCHCCVCKGRPDWCPGSRLLALRGALAYVFENEVARYRERD
jgi:hypothetical protein